LLRKQKGFQDEITLVAPGGNEAVGISLWDQKDNAEAYNRGTYAEVQKALANVLDGAPQVKLTKFATRLSTRLLLVSQAQEAEAERSCYGGRRGPPSLL
jgi:hypothetical protein